MCARPSAHGRARSLTLWAADLGTLTTGDQFGYDAVVGEFHDTTVKCLETSEVPC